MRNVIVSETAEDELRLINEYLSFYSVRAADSFVDAVEDKISMLKEGVVEFPVARDSDLAQAGFRIALVKSYLNQRLALAHASSSQSSTAEIFASHSASSLLAP